LPNSATHSDTAFSFADVSAGRVAVRNGFQWNACDAYLFDIDGTLLRDPSRTHYHAFSEAAESVLGHPISLEGVHVQGSTDPAILRDALHACSLGEAVWRPRFHEILAAITEVVLRRASAMQLRIMPGVEDMLRHLQQQEKLLGVATGNLEAIGWLKVERAGLRKWFRFGGFSDACEERADMIAAAVAQARSICGPDAVLCVIGDTPSDIAAAHANGIPVIAVATGHSTFDELLAHQPDVCTTTLADLLELAAQSSRPSSVKATSLSSSVSSSISEAIPS
jgi:phosphoglycolate phosphatase